MALSLTVSAIGYGTRFLADQVCSSGVISCQYVSSYESSFGKAPKGFTDGTCANYNETYISPENNYYLLIFTSIVAASMAFAIGGNDGANAWATTIHSFAIKLKPACILAGFFEVLGATTIGYGVSTSIQKGISNLSSPDCFACGYCDSSMSLYYVGMMSALISGSIFLLAATWLKMPVSTTHTIVCSVFGMTVVFHGFGCVEFGWNNLGGIIASWFISPVAAGVVSVLFYWLTNYLIFDAKSPRQRGFVFVPVLYFCVVFVIAFLSFVKSPVLKSQPMWVGTIVAVVFAVVVTAVVVLKMVPYIKKNMPSVNEANRIGMHLYMTGDVNGTHEADGAIDAYKEVNKSPLVQNDEHNGELRASADVLHTQRPSMALLDEYNSLTEEQQDAMYMFKHLLILVACLQSFSHGSNDTANATAALAAVINGFSNGINDCSSPESPWWIMLSGGLFLAAGIWFLGYKVMETIGKDICIVSFQRAFCTEFAAACVVVTSSLLKIPVSTTHCQVGGVVFISMASKDWKTIQWKLVCTILFSWIFTLPATSGMAALIAYVLQFAFKG